MDICTIFDIVIWYLGIKVEVGNKIIVVRLRGKVCVVGFVG